MHGDPFRFDKSLPLLVSMPFIQKQKQKQKNLNVRSFNFIAISTQIRSNVSTIIFL